MQRIVAILFICVGIVSCAFHPSTDAQLPTTTTSIPLTVTPGPAGTVTLPLVPTATHSQEPPSTGFPGESEKRPLRESPSTFSIGEPKWLGRGEIVSASFTPNGTAVAIGWANGVSFVDMETTTERWWQPTDVPIVAIDVHPEGKAVAAGLVDGSIILFDAATGSTRRFAGAGSYARHGDVAWSPDGRWIAFQFVGPNRQDPIYVLDIKRGTLHTVPGSQIAEGKMPALIWTPDGRGITLTDFGEKCTAVLDIQTGETLFTLQIGGKCYFPYAMTWSPDGSRFALAGDSVILVDPHTGKITQTLPGSTLGFTLSGGAFSRFGHPLLFNEDGTFMAGKGGIADLGSGGGFNNMFPLVVWNIETGEQVAQLGEVGNAYRLGPEHKNRLAIAFNGDTVLSLYANGELTRWAFTTDSEEVTVGHIPVIAARPPLTWSADGRKVAALNRYGGVAVWDVETGALVAQFDAPLEAPALSPDGRRIALTDRQANMVIIYDLDTDRVVQTLTESTSLPQATAFSPDGTHIAYGSRSQVIVADVATGERVAVLTGYPDDQIITRVMWGPGGEAIIAASGDPLDSAAGSLILWEHNGDGSFTESFRTKTIHTSNEAWKVALFNPGGNLVALEQAPSPQGPFDTLVYDREAGKVILKLRGYRLAAWASSEVLLTSEIASWTRLTRWNVRTGEKEVGARGADGGDIYAPTGLYFARPVPLGGMTIYDWATGNRVASGFLGSDPMEIAWSPDGHWLAALATDGMIRVWPVKTNEGLSQLPGDHQSDP